MRTKIFITLFLLSISSLTFAQTGVVNNGAKIIVTNSAIINIDGAGTGGYTNQSSDAVNHGRIDLAGKLKIEGDWQNNATSGFVFISTKTDGEIVFDGSSQQSIAGTAITNFEKTTFNNSSGFLLNNSARINGDLTLTSGIINIGAYNLYLDSVVNLSGSPGVAAMIVANSSGYVYKYFNTPDTFLFPVGDTAGTSVDYSPFAVKFNDGIFGSNAYVKVNVVNDKHPNNSSATHYLNRYWSVSQNNITSIDAHIKGQYNQTDVSSGGSEINIYGAKYDMPYWQILNAAYVTGDSITGDVTSFSDFTGAESTSVLASISMADDGLIDEGAESGELITVTLINDDFVTNLNPTNWTLLNLPDGVSKGTLTRTGDKTATIELSGNSSTDFDTDITNITLQVSDNELVNTNSGSISDSDGVTIQALDDPESISMEDDGLITEGNEDGEIITVTLTGGTFASLLNINNWALSNMPDGVSLGGIERINNTTVEITLQGNAGSDYDTDSTNTTLTITSAEVDDYSGSDFEISTGVVFVAIDESLTISMTGAMNEGGESGETIVVTISGKVFANPLTESNWVLSNLPNGVSKQSVTRDSDTQATITLTGNSIEDFDDNILNTIVQIKTGEIDSYASAAYVTSGVTITATDDEEVLSLSYNSPINEGAEDGEIITVNLTGGTFANPIDSTQWSTANLPEGVSIGSFNRINATSVELTLSGNNTVDYDSHITDFTVTMNPSQVDDTTGAALSIATGVSFTANIDAESIAIADDTDLNEGSEDGEIITVTLTGGTFVNPLTPTNWSISNQPTGVSLGDVIRISSTSVQLELLGNTTEDYDNNILDFTVTIQPDEINDHTSSVISQNNGVTFKATDEPVVLAISDDGIIEKSENGEIITAVIEEDTFVASLNEINWTLTNLPQGVSLGSLNRIADDTVQITLEGNRSKDYDVDITNLTLEIAGAELTQHTTSPITASSGVLFDAVNDVESITMTDDGDIVEGTEDGEVITVTLSGGTFASSLTPASWSLTSVPDGVSIGTITRVDSVTATIALLGNASVDYDTDITNAELSVPATDVDDHTGNSLTANTGVTFTAVIESVDLTINDNGIAEGEEDGEIIDVTIANDTFVEPLNPENWQLTNLPSGVDKGAITRTGNTTATIQLMGNRSVDYDSDILNMTLTIEGDEFSMQSAVVSQNNGVVFTALNDAESITINDDGGIVEGNEDGETITVEVNGGTFGSSLTSGNWTLSNLPAGVSVGSVFRTNDTIATITLSGNSSSDYDANITNVGVSVTDAEIDDYAGSNLEATGDVIFTALNELVTILHDGLTEENLDGAEIALILENDSFVDAALDVPSFTLNNAPTGLSVDYLTYISNDTALLYLTFNETDFDSDITTFSIQIDGTELLSGYGVTSNTLTISATIEDVLVTMSDDGITEGQENNEVITVAVEEDEFVASPVLANWEIPNLPTGVSLASISRPASDTVKLTLQGYRQHDFDTNINLQLNVAAAEFINSSTGFNITSGAFIVAVNDVETISLSDDGIYEGNENGEVITVSLTGGTFVSTINENNWSVSGLPTGVSVGNVVKTDSVTAYLTLSGNATVDYDNNINSVKLNIAPGEIDDHSGTNVISSGGVVFVAVNDDEVITMSDDGDLVEGNEDGEMITVVIDGGTFVNPVNEFKWVTENLPEGISIGSISNINDTAVQIILSGHSTSDYDEDIINFSLSINADQIYDYDGVMYNIADGVIFKAKNEAASILHAGLTEDNLNEANIELTLSEEAFSDATLLTEGFNLVNVPTGLEIADVTYNTATSASILLSFDGTDFDESIGDFHIEIDASEILGKQPLKSDSLVISALNDEEILAINDDGQILEGSEDGEVITVTLSGGTFANVLDINNWTISNGPPGVSIASLNPLSHNVTEIVLSGNTSEDYDADITNFTVSIDDADINDLSDYVLSANSGVLFTAVNEVLTIVSSIALSEDNLDGSEITIELTDESFADNTLSTSNFILNNTPLGTSIQSIVYNSATSATVTIAYNGADFDTDITDFNLTILEAELLGIGQLTSNNLTINAVIESQTATISHIGLTEENLNGAQVQLLLTGETFSDGTLSPDNFILIDAPQGTSVSTIDYVDGSNANINLAHEGADFDTDIETFRISIDASELSGAEGIISNMLVITATNDNEVLSMTDDGLIEEGAENGEIITVSLTGGTFVDPLNLSNWTISNVPIGVEVAGITRISSTVAEIELTGNATEDYDDDILAQLIVLADQVDDSTGGEFVLTQGVTFTAITEQEDKSLTISSSGLDETILNGAEITAILENEYLVDDIIEAQNITLNNAPYGLSVDQVNYIDSVSFSIALAFTGFDFDEDIPDFSIQLSNNEINGDVPLISNELSIIANIEDEQITLTSAALNEENLNGSTIDLTVVGDIFLDATLDKANFVLSNGPDTAIVSAVTYTDNTHATITVAYDGTDFDTDITNFGVLVLGTEFAAGNSIRSNNTTITATNDAEEAVIASDGEITERSIIGEKISVTVTGGNFVANLNPDEWTLANAPEGIIVDSLFRMDDFNVEAYLGTDGTVDFDTDFTNVQFSIGASQVNDHEIEPIISGNALTFTAVNEILDITSTSLTEESLNGSFIELTITNDEFIDNTLDANNFYLLDAPEGTSVKAVSYVTVTQATAELLFTGNDFDTDYTLKMGVLSAELLYSDTLISNSLSVTAFNDDEIISLSDDGEILEGQENGEIITVSVSGGNFVDTPSFSSWTYANLPQGVTIGAASVITNHEIELQLSGNVTTNYDVDITDFTVTIPATDVNDYQGADFVINEGVTFIAQVESGNMVISSAIDLNEMNIDGIGIDVELNGAAFGNPAKAVNGITINNGPAGLDAESLEIINDTLAVIYLGFTGEDFDADSNFSVTIEGSLLNPQNTITSNSLVLHASVEPVLDITLNRTVFEGNEEGAQLSVGLLEGNFIDSFPIDSIALDGLPMGVSMANFSYVTDTLITYELAGNRSEDYDTDITGVSQFMESGIFANYYGDDILQNAGIVFNAFNEQLVISHEGLNEGNLDGAVVKMNLIEDNFLDDEIGIASVTLNNAPEGTTINDIVYVDDTTANVVLAFDGTDFSTDYSDFYLRLLSSEVFGLEILTSNSLIISEGTQIFNEKNVLDLRIFSNFADVFIETNETTVDWESGIVSVFDTNGKRVYFGELQKNKLNKIKLDTKTGNYLVKVVIDGTVFVNKVFIMPE